MSTSQVVCRIEGLVFDYALNETDLRATFFQFQPLVDVMLLDEELAPDVCIVEFGTLDAAKRAVEALDGREQNFEGFIGRFRVCLVTPEIERELLVKAHILATGSDPFDLEATRDRYLCKFVLGAEKISSEYSIIGRLVGVGGENVKAISRSTGAHVKVNGKAKSASDPLHVRVASETLEGLQAAKIMTEQLIAETLHDYEQWCGKHYLAVPAIRVIVVEGSEAQQTLGRLVATIH